MRNAWFLAVALVALLVAVAPGSVFAAKPVDHSHDGFTDQFPRTICAIDGVSVVKGVENFTLYQGNRFRDRFEVTETFTATKSGKSLIFHVAQQVTGNFDPIDNGDGTFTFVSTFKGLPEQIRMPNGRMLSRDAGVVTFTDVGHFAADPNTGEPTFILDNETVSGEHGPHPDLDSNFELFCNVVGPALT